MCPLLVPLSSPSLSSPSCLICLTPLENSYPGASVLGNVEFYLVSVSNFRLNLLLASLLPYSAHPNAWPGREPPFLSEAHHLSLTLTKMVRGRNSFV